MTVSTFRSVAAACVLANAFLLGTMPISGHAQKQTPNNPSPSSPKPENASKEQEALNRLEQEAHQKIEALMKKLDQTRHTDAKMRPEDFEFICKRELPPEVYGKISAKLLSACVKSLTYEFYQCSPYSKKKICASLGML